MSECSICKSSRLSYIGSLPFDHNAVNRPIINDRPVEYFQCRECHTVQAPEIIAWDTDRLSREVYNEEYIYIDPTYAEERPSNFAKFFLDNIKYQYKKKIKHLDYGGGNGAMSRLMNSGGISSISYDPFVNKDRPLGKFNFITAVEVMEHSQNSLETLKDMVKFMQPGGVIAISTHLAPPNCKIDWWYICPRGGHINILSLRSLKILAEQLGYNVFTDGGNLHTLHKDKKDKAKVLGW